MSEESKQTKISVAFQRAWIGHELPGYRKVDATYGLFPYDSLPPLNRKLDGSLSWLTEMDTVVRKEMEPHWRSDRDRCRIDARLEPTIAEAERQGYGLPNVFLSFMRSQSARQRIPSYAACYFDAPDCVVAAPPPGNGILIRFMNDQQWCLLWSLYVEPGGGHAVVVSDVALDVDSGDKEQEEQRPGPNLLLCADSFEEFLYRIWIESNACFALTYQHRDLSPSEKQYLAFYRR